MGVNNLIEIFDEKYYDNLRGGILEAFGKLFVKNLKVFSGTIIRSIMQGQEKVSCLTL